MQAFPHRIARVFVCFTVCALVLVSFQSAFAKTQLTFNPRSLRFGEIAVGSTATLTTAVTNNGSTAITISTMNVSPSAYTVSQLSLPLTLNPGQSATFNVSFSPAANGIVNGNLSFNGGSSNLNLFGGGTSAQSLLANPPSLAFGNVPSGGSTTTNVVITNSSTGTITVYQQSITSEFATSGLSLPLTLTAGQSYTFGITFAPTSVTSVIGAFKGMDGNGRAIVGVPLSGTGTTAGQLTVAPPSINFGNVNVGSTGSQTGTLTASGASVTVSAITSNNGEFGFTGLQLPATIAAGQSVGYSATFTPESSGSASATLTFVSNASDSNTTQSLSGTGLAQHQVSLAWDPSTSTVVGYNVYRGVKSGGPYNKLNSTVDPNTSYVDTTVGPSQTYYYVTTSVNSTGQESGYSNQAKAVIP